MTREELDDRIIRCARIGDLVPFKYCRGAGNPFCPTIIQCWACREDIGQYLADNFTPEEIESGLKKPEGNRVSRIVDMAKSYRSDEPKP